jgi:catechol 2,3-dioxygenase-like lactoylglutathione lyase family enzyme
MFDHVGLKVADYEQSKKFYEVALAPLGVTLLLEPAARYAGFGIGQPTLWIQEHRAVRRDGLHIAFTAEDRAAVDAFHTAALAVGGVDNGRPGVREIYHPNYYSAYVLDPDGNNIEAVCQSASH